MGWAKNVQISLACDYSGVYTAPYWLLHGGVSRGTNLSHLPHVMSMGVMWRSGAVQRCDMAVRCGGAPPPLTPYGGNQIKVSELDRFVGFSIFFLIWGVT